MYRLLSAIFIYLALTCSGLAQTQCITPPQAPATPVVTTNTSGEGSHILKGSPGCLISVYVYNPGAAAFLLIYNSATVPADGTQIPIECVPVAATGYQFINYTPQPSAWFSNGIVAVLSTTGCFTKTIGTGAFFHALVQ